MYVPTLQDLTLSYWQKSPNNVKDLNLKPSNFPLPQLDATKLVSQRKIKHVQEPEEGF